LRSKVKFTSAVNISLNPPALEILDHRETWDLITRIICTKCKTGTILAENDEIEGNANNESDQIHKKHTGGNKVTLSGPQSNKTTMIVVEFQIHHK
jgi:hypothetical protein